MLYEICPSKSLGLKEVLNKSTYVRKNLLKFQVINHFLVTCMKLAGGCVYTHNFVISLDLASCNMYLWNIFFIIHAESM